MSTHHYAGSFEQAACTRPRLQGVPDRVPITIPHRKGGETDDDQRRKAESALPAIIAKLVQQPL